MVSQWWNGDKESWQWEQEEIEVHLREWVLWARDYPALKTNNLIVGKILEEASTAIGSRDFSSSVLFSDFFWYPDFRITFSFGLWEGNGLGQFQDLGSGGRLFSQEHFRIRMPACANFSHQFNQLSSFIKQLLKRGNLFHSLTKLEKWLKGSATKGLLSKIYSVLIYNGVVVRVLD